MEQKPIFEYTQTISDLKTLSTLMRGIFLGLVIFNYDEKTSSEMGLHLSNEIRRLIDETNELLSLAMKVEGIK